MSLSLPSAVFAFLGTTLVAGSLAAAEPSKKECVAANESGQDLRHSGKLRDARTALAVCMSSRCPGPIREDCAQRLNDIEAAMPMLVFVAKDPDGRDLSEVRVAIDGQPLLDRLTGSSVAIDPGEHHFTFEAVNFSKGESTVIVREGDKERRILVTLEGTAPVAQEPAPSVPPPVTTPPPAEPVHSNGSAVVHYTGLGIGIAGIAGIAVGSIFGIMSKSTYDTAHGECNTGKNCDAQAIQDRKTAGSQSDISTVAWIAGGALLATGAVMYFATPSGPVTVGTTADTHGVGLDFRGHF